MNAGEIVMFGVTFISGEIQIDWIHYKMLLNRLHFKKKFLNLVHSAFFFMSSSFVDKSPHE